jgi:hypothetical protein
MRCDAMRCDAMRCDAMRCDATRRDAMRCDAMRCDAMRCDHLQERFYIVGAGDTFGESAVMDRKRYSATYRARLASELLSLSREQLLEALAQHSIAQHSIA